MPKPRKRATGLRATASKQEPVNSINFEGVISLPDNASRDEVTEATRVAEDLLVTTIGDIQDKVGGGPAVVKAGYIFRDSRGLPRSKSRNLRRVLPVMSEEERLEARNTLLYGTVEDRAAKVAYIKKYIDAGSRLYEKDGTPEDPEKTLARICPWLDRTM